MTLKAAQRLLARGFAPIPVPAGTKAPRLAGWQDLRLTAADLPQHFANGANIGVLNGAPSGGLADVDLDAPESLAVADVFLPRTGVEFGRSSKRRSHRAYICEPSTDTAQFRDPDGAMLVELRSTGTQTVWAGTHPSGEAIRFDRDGDPAQLEGADLHTAVARLAACALLARHWPRKNGSRHEIALAVAGYLLRGGLDEKTVEKIVLAAARVAGDEEAKDRTAAVMTTAKKIAAGKKATGAPTLAALIGDKPVAKLAEWLNLGPARDAAAGGDRLAVRESVVKPFPVEIFPRALQRYVREGAVAYQCPPDYFAVPLLVLGGAAIGTSRALEIKGGWLESPRMNAALVGAPSDTKTPPLKRVAAPMYEAQREAKEEWRAAMAEWRARRGNKRTGK